MADDAVRYIYILKNWIGLFPIYIKLTIFCDCAQFFSSLDVPDKGSSFVNSLVAVNGMVGKARTSTSAKA